MKTNKKSKKLTLTKKTITSLNKEEICKIKGGAHASHTNGLAPVIQFM